MKYFHGGVPGLKPGDTIIPAPPHVEDGCPICVARAEGRMYTVGEYRQWLRQHPNRKGAMQVLEMLKDADHREPVDPPSKPNRVYITSHEAYARWYAARSRGDLYEVVPDGEIEESDEDNFPSWTCQGAIVARVISRNIRLDRRDRRALMREWDKRDRDAKRKRESRTSYRRVYAIGDIHGYGQQLANLLEEIVNDGFDAKHDHLVFLGDYVDRGHQSGAVIDIVRRMVEVGNATALRGNHEQMMIDAYQAGRGTWQFDHWWYQGGKETAISFSTITHRVQEDVIEWADQLPYTVSIGKYQFVHAGFVPEDDYLTTTTKEQMLWIRDEFLDSDFDFGKIIVHGHTSAKLPVVKNNRIGIDTVMSSGLITAVRLEDNCDPRFITTLQRMDAAL